MNGVGRESRTRSLNGTLKKLFKIYRNICNLMSLLNSKLFLAILFLAIVFSCEKVVMPPPRPVNVPSDAIWAGGVDGGDWIRCVKYKNCFQCAIFEDFKGRLIETGAYLLD